MYKLKKENISGISPIIIENAEKDNMLLNIEGDSYQAETPSFENPSKVEAVGDNINLISNSSNDWEQGTLNGTTGQPQDNSARIRLKEYIDVRNIKSIACNLQNSNYKVVSIHFFGKDYSFITTSSTLYGYGNFNLQNMDLPKNTCYIKVIVSKTDVNSEIEISEIEQCKLKIESGSISTPYSPYNQGSVEIIHKNKNLLYIPDFTRTQGGITCTITNGNHVKITGNSTEGKTFYVLSNNTNKEVRDEISKLIQEKTITLSRSLANSDFSIVVDSVESQYYIELKADTANKTKIMNENLNSLRIYVLPNIEHNLEFDLQLELSDNATEFISPYSKSYILPIQKPMFNNDYFIKQNRKWYEVHNWEEYTFTGNETYAKSEPYSNDNWFCGFMIGADSIIEGVKEEALMYANKFSRIGSYVNILDENCIRSTSQMHVRVDTSYLSENTAVGYQNLLKQWYDEGNPLVVHYQMQEPVLIECTQEQSNILNNFETFEGQNTITIDTFNNTNPNILIDYTPKMIDEVKQAFTTNITKAYIIRTSDGFEINQDNYLKDYKFEELRFVPDNGFLGGTVARRLTLNFNNVDNQFNIQDEDLRFYAGVEYEGKDYYIDYGNFIVQKPETENTTDNTNVIALDYMCLLNATYNDEMTYPCTLGELAENVCSQAGLELATKTFRNSDFIVEDNQFVNGETLRNVLSGIVMSAFSWARIGQDNKVYIDFQIKQKEDISLNYDNYFNLAMASKLYGPINKIILRNSQIEGENVTVQDDESIAENGVHELVIADNPFAYTQEKREQLIEAGKEFYGFTYMPINSMDTIGYAFLDSNSLMKITDMQDKEIYAYAFNHTIDYDGSILDSIESPALTETETKYTYTPEDSQRLKRTEIIVNKHEQTISSIIQEQDELGNRQNIIEQDLDSTTDTISKVNEDLTEQINQLRIDLDGLTQNVSQKGGDNIFSYAKEFWTGETDEDEANLEEYTNTEIQQNSVSGIGYMIKQGISIQKVQVKNDTYTISFSYKKLIELATGYVLINGNRYDLTSTDWDEIVATINVETNYVDFEIISDTANAFEIFDLMGAIGNEKQIWSQNANETRTDTVKIGKGITVSSSSTKTIWKADSDGNRIINTDTNEVVAEFTDKGTTTKNLKVNDTAEIAGILIQEIDGQTWISSLL